MDRLNPNVEFYHYHVGVVLTLEIAREWHSAGSIPVKTNINRINKEVLSSTTKLILMLQTQIPGRPSFIWTYSALRSLYQNDRVQYFTV